MATIIARHRGASTRSIVALGRKGLPQAAPAPAPASKLCQRGYRQHHHRHLPHSRSRQPNPRRWKSSSSSSSSSSVTPEGGGSKSKTKKNLPPLPPLPSEGGVATTKTSPTTTKEMLSSPAQAKQRYLESKRRTEQKLQAEFLKDPHSKMTQLQKELDEVKLQALQKLEREVYNKTVWQRLTDPLRRKQHSFINMVCATFAYILAYNLHLKSKAHKEALVEVEKQTAKTQELRTLLRSLLSDTTVQEIADKTLLMDRKDSDDSDDGSGGVVDDALKSTTDNANTKSFWGWFNTSSSSRTKDVTGVGRSSSSANSTPTSVVIDKDNLVQALKSVLEEKIGDEGLDDETKKQKTIQKIWKKNNDELLAQKQQQKQQPGDQREEDLLKVLPVQILLSSSDSDQDDEDTTNSVGKAAVVDDLTTTAAAPPTNNKKERRRVFDM